VSTAREITSQAFAASYSFPSWIPFPFPSGHMRCYSPHNTQPFLPLLQLQSLLSPFPLLPAPPPLAAAVVTAASAAAPTAAVATIARIPRLLQDGAPPKGNGSVPISSIDLPLIFH